MSGSFDVIVARLMREHGLRRADQASAHSDCGSSYLLPPAVGSGGVWTFRAEAHLGLVMIDAMFRQPFALSLRGVSCTCISFFQRLSGTTDALTETLYVNEPDPDAPVVCFLPGGRVKGMILLFDPALGLGELFGTGRFRPAPKLLPLNGLRHIPELNQILVQIEQCPIRGDSDMAKLFYRAKLQELCTLLLGIAARPSGIGEGSVKAEDRRQIRRLRAYIEQHLDEELDLDALARAVQMSRSKLKYTFKATCGKTVRQYRDMLREQRACEALLRSDIAVSQLAQQLGFASASSFCRFFKNRTGMTPHAFRLQKCVGASNHR
ncbi:MAG: helix-turn-helix transcriptional regulator [Oscillospiraceae bacterium]|nr:helix-turn-helix transcriptional regulator [Oscillospiraceae bacterium]